MRLTLLLIIPLVAIGMVLANEGLDIVLPILREEGLLDCSIPTFIKYAKKYNTKKDLCDHLKEVLFATGHELRDTPCNKESNLAHTISVVWYQIKVKKFCRD